jgi:glycosyltransferase involved in cell wall biosynthesis
MRCCGSLELAVQLGVSDRVRFWGDVPELNLSDSYHACAVFVFPSVTPNEAFGMAQLEAMACSKPLVACQLDSGVPFVCAHGRNGWIVPPGDSKALAKALATWISNPDLRRALGSAGRHRASTEFSRATMIQRYWDLFREVVPANTPR